MEIKRIIFIFETPRKEDEFDRFGGTILQERGYQVEFWSTFPISYPELYKPGQLAKVKGLSILNEFKTLSSVIDEIRKLTSQDLLFDSLGLSFNNRKIIFEISKSEAFLAKMKLGNCPIPPVDLNIGELLEKTFRSPRKILDYFIKKFPNQFSYIRPASFFLRAGEKSTLERPYSNEKTQFINLHTLEYDLYLTSLKNEKSKNENYVVFLDEDAVFHSDIGIRKLSYPISPEEYFPKLNKFFKLVEEKFNCDVVVAAHPKSNYEMRLDFFEGRKVIKGNTLRLVRNCKFAIALRTNSTNFGIIFNKPIVFITFNGLKGRWDGLLGNELARSFGKTPYNLDSSQPINWEKENSISAENYKKYLNSYIKYPGSPNKPAWEIFVDYLDSLR
jgi:hypothetical protein